MTCQHSNRLSQWLDGELPPEEERDFSAHLASCNVCRRAREDFLELRADLRAMPWGADPFASRRALTNILTTAGPQRWWRHRVGVPVPLLAVIVIGLVLAVGLHLRTTPAGRPVAAVAENTMPRDIEPDPNLSRFDRGQRAVLLVVPREPGSPAAEAP